MCMDLFKQSTDAQAAALQQQQQISAQAQATADAAAAKTTATVAQDQGTINQAFKQFDPRYYNDYRKAYTGYYDPQVADQYSQAHDQLVAALAGNGTLESSVGAQALGNLAKANTDQVAQIQQQADAAVTNMRQQVSGDKTALYNQANAAVDPTQIASTAQANTTALAAPPAYTPLSSVFSSLVTPFSNYTKSAAGAAVPGQPVAQPVTANAYNQQSGGAYG